MVVRRTSRPRPPRLLPGIHDGTSWISSWRLLRCEVERSIMLAWALVSHRGKVAPEWGLPADVASATVRACAMCHAPGDRTALQLSPFRILNGSLFSFGVRQRDSRPPPRDGCRPCPCTGPHAPQWYGRVQAASYVATGGCGAVPFGNSVRMRVVRCPH